jgi:hypothetical protein
VLALVIEQVILLLLFLLQLDHACEALAGGVVVLVVGIEGLGEVVVAAEETSQSPQIVELREISIVLALAVFAGVSI